MVDPEIRVGADVGCKTHWVGIADPDAEILEEFVIPHHQEGFQEFFDRGERHRLRLSLSVAASGMFRSCNATSIQEATADNHSTEM